MLDVGNVFSEYLQTIMENYLAECIFLLIFEDWIVGGI